MNNLEIISIYSDLTFENVFEIYVRPLLLFNVQMKIKTFKMGAGRHLRKIKWEVGFATPHIKIILTLYKMMLSLILVQR